MKLMTDVLENERNLWLTHFRSQQVIMVVLELRISEMIPARGVEKSKISRLGQTF